MLDIIFNSLSEALNANVAAALFASFGWGLLSIVLSPCHLTGIPLIIGFLSSQGSIGLKRMLALSLTFALGILLTIAAIGGITLLLGRLMGDIGNFGAYIVVIIFIAVGLYLLDIIKLPWSGAEIGNPKFKGLPAALILGLIFGFGVGPCTFAFMAPVLGVVFELSHTKTAMAAGLLVAFAAGHCFVIVLAGVLVNKVQSYLNWSANSKTFVYIRKTCGALVILGGIYLFVNTIL